jgi:hypothetical protein
MVNIKMTIEDRNKYLSTIEDEINSKLHSIGNHPDSREFDNNTVAQTHLSDSTIINLAERDDYLSKVEQEIKSKRELLLEKRKYLNKISRDNRFLRNVSNDYQNYYDFIVKQKEDQMKSLNYLNDYLEDMMVNSKITEQDIVETTREQKRVLNEIKYIKKSLDKIIQN